MTTGPSVVVCLPDTWSALEVRILNSSLPRRKTETQRKDRLAQRHTANNEQTQYLGLGWFAMETVPWVYTGLSPGMDTPRGLVWLLKVNDDTCYVIRYFTVLDLKTEEFKKYL